MKEPQGRGEEVAMRPVVSAGGERRRQLLL